MSPGRSLAFAQDLLLARRGRLAHPLKITAQLTSRCTLSCQQCGIPGGPQHHWGVEDIRNFVRENPRLTWVNLTGGELFSHPAGEAIFEPWLALKRLRFFHFPTSGWRWHEAARTGVMLARECRRRGINFAMSVSVDGPPEVHDQRRGRAGSFERAVALLRELRGAGVAVYPGMTVDAANAPLIPQTLVEIQKQTGIGPGEVHFNLVHESDHYYHNHGYLQRLSQAVNPALALPPQPGFGPRQWLERTYRRLARQYQPGGPSPAPCGVGKASLFLSADGTVYPCTIWASPLGHLRQTGFALSPIWQGYQREQARVTIARRACPGCWTPCEAFVSLLVGVDRNIPRRVAVPDTPPVVVEGLAPLRPEAGG